MQGYLPPKGIIAELITPLNSDLSLAEDDLITYLSYITPFVNGIMLLSPVAGEGFEIALEDKKRLIEMCIKTIKEKLSIFVFITSETEEETVENMLSFEKILNEVSYKGNIYWVDAPLYYRGNRGLPDFYKNMTKASAHPIILYNNPEVVKKIKGPFNRKNIRTSILRELSLIEGIKGLIHAGDLRRALNYQRAIRERPSFRIYDGDEELFLNFPNKNGLLSVSVNFIPQLWKKIMDSNSNNKLKSIWLPLKELLGLIKEGGVFLVKRILKDQNIISSCFCVNDLEVDEALLNKTKQLISTLKELYEKM